MTKRKMIFKDSPMKVLEQFSSFIGTRSKIFQHKLPYFFALLFFAKAIVLGFWVTPLWDIPDETRHFNYARDLATGKGIPDRYNSPSDIDIISSVSGRNITTQGDKNNWQSKHPPLYYILAAAAWKIASWLTSDPDTLFRAPRIVAAMAGTATLLVIYHLMLLLTEKRNISLAVMASISFVPMFSNLSSGTNHDTTVTFFASIATYFWCRFFLRGNIKNAYWSALYLSLAAGTKMTALVMAAPMMATLVLQLSSPWHERIKQILYLASISLFLPGLWIVRNYFKYDNPMIVTGLVIKGQSNAISKLNTTLLDYLSQNNIIEQFFAHFWGLFGWSGRYAAPYKMHLIRITGEPLNIYYIITALLVFLGILSLLQCLKSTKISDTVKNMAIDNSISSWVQGVLKPVVSSIWFPRTAWVVLFFEGVFILSNTVYPSVELSFQVVIRTGVFTALSMLVFISVLSFILPLDMRNRLSFYAVVVFVFFAFLLLWKLYNGYLLSGVPRAIHGRYFFPLIPMLLVGLLIPILEKLKFREWPLLIVATVLGSTELYVYASSVLPFFIVFYKAVP